MHPILSSSLNNDKQPGQRAAAATTTPRLFLVMLTMTSRKTPFLRGQLKNQRLNFFVVLLLLIYLQSVAKYGILSGSELKNNINFDAFAICNYRICKIFFYEMLQIRKKMLRVPNFYSYGGDRDRPPVIFCDSAAQCIYDPS